MTSVTCFYPVLWYTSIVSENSRTFPSPLYKIEGRAGLDTIPSNRLQGLPEP